MVSFGEDCKKLFLLEEGFTFLNHGSFGCIPRPVFQAYMKLLEEVESNCDSWFRYKKDARIQKSLKYVARVMNCEAADLVFVENATTGVQTALKNIKLGPGESILITSLSYPGIINTAKRQSEDIGGVCHVLNLDPPISSSEEVVDKYRKYILSHPDIKVAVVDHITSPSTILMPVKKIVEVCHANGVKVVVDGAHAPGHVLIDIKEIDPEYYTGNLHKWFFCPRGCAVLYIKSHLQDKTQPMLASTCHHEGFPHNFFTQATRDYTPYCIVPEAFKFHESLGGREAISAYCSNLSSWAANMLSNKWSEPKLPIPDDMLVPGMAVVRLPTVLQGDKVKVVEVLTYKYKISVAIEFTSGELWMRFCSNVYNTKEDYVRLADAVLDLMKQPDKLMK